MCTGMDAHVLQLSVARRLRTARRSSLTENDPRCARAQVVRVHILTPILSPPIYSPNFLAGKVTHQRASTDLVSGLARAAWLIPGVHT